MNPRHMIISFAALAALICTAPAMAEKASDNLRIVWRDALRNVDPYYNQLRVGLIVAHHYLDTLVYRDPEGFKIKPQLAKSWTQVDDTTIEFELREDVKFHNGDKFSADDVIYTINTVISPESKVTLRSNVNWIAKAEKIGEVSVRVTYKKPFPAALEYFALVIPIWPKDYRTRVGPEGSALCASKATALTATRGGPRSSLENKTVEELPDPLADGPLVPASGTIAGSSPFAVRRCVVQDANEGLARGAASLDRAPTRHARQFRYGSLGRGFRRAAAEADFGRATPSLRQPNPGAFSS